MVKRDITVFQDLLKKLREEKGLSLEQLCDGLYKRRDVGYLEQEGREVCLLMQDMLLERLGLASEASQHYVDYEEYDKWELRQRILHNITFENIERAEELLEKYRQELNPEDKLERQFYLSQLAQIRKVRGAEDTELYHLFDEALRLTIPTGVEDFDGLVLSVKELNLMLEKEQYRAGGARVSYLDRIVQYVENKKFDRIGEAKIYSKAVCFWCQSALQDEEFMSRESAVSILLARCDRALDALREASRLYFMWEILGLRAELMERRIAEIDKSFAGKEQLGTMEYRERLRLKDRQKENAEWQWAINSVYAEFGVRKETWEYCYLYVKKGVYCINDVIRIRRKMFGLTAVELRRGICEEEVLRRLEHRVSKPRRYNVCGFFERLGLATELNRTEIISGNPEMKQLVEKLNKEINSLHWSRVEELLMAIEERAPIETRVNQQALMQKQIFLRWENKNIQDEEFRKIMQGILEMTLPLTAFLKEGEKYLTNIEQICIQNLMRGMDKDSEEFRICIQRFEEYYVSIVDRELLDSVSNMYECIMKYVGSELGNRGEYEISDAYNRSIVEGCLRFRRTATLPSGLYGRWWNYDKRKGEGIPVKKELDDEKELNKCILISKLDKQDERMKFYINKLKQVKGRGR